METPSDTSETEDQTQFRAQFTVCIPVYDEAAVKDPEVPEQYRQSYMYIRLVKFVIYS